MGCRYSLYCQWIAYTRDCKRVAFYYTCVHAVCFIYFVNYFGCRLTRGFYIQTETVCVKFPVFQVRTMNEYLANIRFIKMYSWEKPLSKFIAGTCVYLIVK